MNVVDSSGWLQYFAGGPRYAGHGAGYNALLWTQDADFEGMEGASRRR
jgi:hypothetical protein